MSAAGARDYAAAEVLPGNRGMLAVFARSGLPMKGTTEDGVVHVALSLAGATAS